MSEFMLGQGLGHELEMAIGRTGGITADVQWLRTGSNFENVRLLARGEAELVLKPKPVVAGAIIIDPIVRVDRSIRPVYPDFLNQEYLKKSEFIALERLGPSEFDASRLRKWWHPKQKKGRVLGDVIHDVLVKKNLLSSCLGFADLLGIKAKGIEFFRQHFKGQAVFGWRSVVPNRDGYFLVPCLVERGGAVVQRWLWLGHGFGAAGPALRFAKLDLRSLET